MSKRKRDEHEANATEDWRESVTQVTTDEQYQYMLEHDILTDCTFVVGPEDGETREFKAHKVHIARVNAVFEAMLLRSEMIEAKTGHVRVTDLSANTFQLLLSSIYGKKPEMKSFQEAQDLAFAADKYQMKVLLEICVSRMVLLISPENIWTALETADLLRNKRFKQVCMKVLQCDTLRCITDAGFMQASEENVALLLEKDKLNVDDELLLVNMIVRWARHAARQRGLSNDDSGVRAVLEPRLLSLFRLLAMSPQQFMLGPGLAGWLTSAEKTVISDCLQFRGFSKLPRHLSSVVQKRENVTFATFIAANLETEPPSELLVCKREILGYRPDVQQTHKYGCDCQGWFDHDSPPYFKCVHATLIFRAKASCKWLGFQCSTRCRSYPVTDLEVLWNRHWHYDEDININLYTYSNTLSTDCDGSKIEEMTFKVDEDFVKYDSSTTAMFDKPVLLVPDKWFGIQIGFWHKDSDVPAGEYPNPARARNVRTTAGVEFEFHTEEWLGYHNSENDGIFESLIFSL